MVEKENVAPSSFAGLGGCALGGCALVVLRGPPVPPGCDLGGWLVWLEGACVNDAWRVRIGTGIKYWFDADEEDVGEVFPA